MVRLGLMFGVVAMVLTGCSQVAKQSELDRSLETWGALKAENGEYYRYETSFGSWAGFGDTTTLTVQDDEVVARAYEAYVTTDAGERQVTSIWTEEGAAVGSHEEGVVPRTVDELYSVCRDEVLTQNAFANDFYLSFRDDGVLAYCEYAPKDCVDDCSSGVNITDLEFLSAKTN